MFDFYSLMESKLYYSIDPVKYRRPTSGTPWAAKSNSIRLYRLSQEFREKILSYLYNKSSEFT